MVCTGLILVTLMCRISLPVLLTAISNETLSPVCRGTEKTIGADADIFSNIARERDSYTNPSF